MGQKYDDEKAAEFYADPANRSSAGRKPTRRKAQGLTTHVPIRFRPESIEAIKRLAHEDGMTVSGWVRLLCEREIEARTPSWPFTIGSETPSANRAYSDIENLNLLKTG